MDRRLNQAGNQRVAIIGGGLSGLATAVQLHLLRADLDIALFEAADRCGGVIQTEVAAPFLIDHGADMFATNPPAAINLLEQIGVADRLIEPNQRGRGAMIVHDGKPVPIPDGFVLMRATKLLPMLSTPLLSPLGKLRFLCERWMPARDGEQDQSVGQFVRQRMGREVLDRLVGPLVAGIYTADVDRLSMAATMGPIAAMQREHGSLAKATRARRRSGADDTERGSSGARYGNFRAFPGGMTELIESLVDALPKNTIHTSCPISSITRNNDGQWQVHATSADAAFDHVVVAVPPRQAGRLISDHTAIAASKLAEIESASTAIVVLGVRHDQLSRPQETFGFVVPPIEERNILAVSFASQKFPGRAPDDCLLIRVFMGGALQAHLLEKSDDELQQLARNELADLLGLSGEPLVSRVVRWQNAMPQYHVGHKKRAEQIDAAIAKVPGLSLATNALHGVGIAPVIRSAGNVAQQVVKDLQQQQQ